MSNSIMRHSFVLLLLSFALFVVASSGSDCKCSPDLPCWPSDSEWTALNASLSGSLIRGVPPGSVCYKDQPNYSEALCEVALGQWSNSTWHAQNPISIDYQMWVNNSCNPVFPNGTSVGGDPDAGARGCTIGDYPIYAVAATQPEHVSTALQWAGEKNIRAVIKSTGHNFPGRNTGYGSLSIWTHNLRGAEYIEDFKPTACPTKGTLNAVRISAGDVGMDAQLQAASNGHAVVMGSDHDVGLIGWLTGGGHGHLTASYGMGADNLLEATVVTPNGTLLTTNPCQNSDIFFATRGGGGGTFGVVISAVTRAFPTPQTTKHSLNISSISPNTSTEFWDIMAFLHSELPGLKAGGMAGYYEIAGQPYVPTLSFEWIFFLYDKPNGTVEALIQPIIDRLNNESTLFTYISEIATFPTYLDAYNSLDDSEPVGSGALAYGSHMLSPESLADQKLVAQTLGKIGPSANLSRPSGPFGQDVLLGHLIAAADPPHFYYPEVESLTPAWRNTTTHIIAMEGWPAGANETAVKSVYVDITENKIQPLRDLSPDTGAYFNECDSNEPEWQTAFWGPNYQRLYAIKQKYDPEGVLWCSLCVGSELWTQQDDGRLCRTTQ